MDAVGRAFVEDVLTLAAWRAAKDVESLVAHWVIEERASLADLAEARSRVCSAKHAHDAARRRYTRLSAARLHGAA